MRRLLMAAGVLAVAVPAGIVAVSMLPAGAAVTPIGGGVYTLAAAASGKCVDVPSSSTTSGTQLQQYGCGDGTKTNQLWTFTASAAASGKFLVKSVATGLCVSTKDGSTARNNPIVEGTCSYVARMRTTRRWATRTATARTRLSTAPPRSTTTASSCGAAASAMATASTSAT